MAPLVSAPQTPYFGFLLPARQLQRPCRCLRYAISRDGVRGRASGPGSGARSVESSLKAALPARLGPAFISRGSLHQSFQTVRFSHLVTKRAGSGGHGQSRQQVHLWERGRRERSKRTCLRVTPQAGASSAAPKA